ncbi:MAG: NAD(P)-dependent glycerol-1-phosphate dehydrogenase [Candidatus Thermoplasmatota archaeon]|nr:NAD(P)-dependent glycerol-1-phosphate dehydrogenase [Candidatus Thermoplasmatota archaeon]
MEFSKAKSMVFPRQVLVGHKVIEDIGTVCKNLELKNSCLVITGSNSRKIAGEVVKEILEEEGYDVFMLELGDATKENIDKAIIVLEESKADFILGVGGGSKIDIAKLVAKQNGKSFISVPTSASHDGIVSPRASLKSNHGNVSIEGSTPIAIVADTAIIVKAPYRMLASGCGDVISNLTAVKDWLLAHKLKNEPFSSTAAALAEMSAKVIIQNVDKIKQGTEESVWLTIKPIIESGAAMCIAGSSRPCSGSEHLFSHALDILASGKALHGEQCGIGAIMMMYLHNGNWEELRNALRELKAPVTAKELGIEKELVLQALTMAHKIRTERYTILGDKGLSLEAAEKLASATEVI